MGRSGSASTDVHRGPLRESRRLVAVALCALFLFPAAARGYQLPPTVTGWVGFTPMYLIPGVAILRASVNPNGSAVTDCHFVWGDGEAPCQPMPGTGTARVDVSANVPSPSPNVLFNVVATNAGGTATGPAMVSSVPVAWSPPPPRTGPDWAILYASVNPQGATVVCSFQFGTDPGLGPGSDSAPCVPQPTGDRPVEVSARITGLSPDTTYYYRVSLTSQNGPSFDQAESFTTLPPPPDVTTGAATDITATSVTLHGTVNPHGLQTTCVFHIGTSSYGSDAPCVPEPGDGNQPVPVTATVPATPGSVLHYRLVATNAAGTYDGADQTVTVLAATPPTIADTTVQRIARPTATGAATVNPNGSPTECWFEAGSTHVPCTPQPGDGTSPVAVTAPVPVFGTLISFRVVASNAGGTTYGPQVGMAILWVPPPRPGTLRVAAIGTPRRGRIAVSLACDGNPRDFCRGTLTLTARVRLHGRRRVVALGSAPYDLTVRQQRATVAVRLSRRGRRVLGLRPRPRIAAHAVPAAPTP